VNQIQALLDRWELPWRDTRREIEQRFGVHTCPWSNLAVVALPRSSATLTGLLRPFSYWHRDVEPADYPPLWLSGSLWVAADAMTNLEAARAQLEPLLGIGQSDDTSNTRSWVWQDGPAKVRIIAWLPNLQSDFGPNAWHEREPRLATACSIEIETGSRIACSDYELEQLRGFIPAIALPTPPLAEWLFGKQPQRGWWAGLLFEKLHAGGNPSLLEKVAAAAISPAEQPFIRLPTPNFEEIHGKAGISPDGEMLILCNGRLMLVPLSAIADVHMIILDKARGPGRKIIELRCRHDARVQGIALNVIETALELPLEKTAHALADLIKSPLTVERSIDH
jgi:hypothetical protein